MTGILVFAILIGLYLLLMWKAGHGYPILYLFAFTYFVQYIFSTYLIYNEYNVLAKQMPIPQEQFFSYTITALLFLFGGVFIFHKEDTRFQTLFGKIQPDDARKLGFFLIFVSYLFDLLSNAGLSYFDSVVSFTTYMKYLAAFCLLFSRSKLGYCLIAVVYVQLAITVLATGVFISFFVWATFFFFFLALKLRLSFLLRICFILIALPVLILVQTVKHDYRNRTWKGGQEGGVKLFSELVEKSNKENKDQPFEESEGVVRTVGRLSQGWHLGLTLHHVPSREPFADGAELGSDIVASIIPRIIFSEKKTVNSQAKFEQYTGHKLHGTTSMSIGVLGDFYKNFGEWGSYIMLFIFGVIIAKMYGYFLKRYVYNDPLNIIWIPFILSYLIRANNDFYIFFNGMVKGFVIFLVVNYVRHNFISVRRKNRFPPKASFSS